jgi:hypothetical protein
MPTPPLTCTLTEAEFQKRRVEVLQKLKGHIQEQKELSNGYALRFDADDQRLEDVVQLIRLERKCCSFLTLKLTAEPSHGPLWLELTGPIGAKRFIKDEMNLAT